MYIMTDIRNSKKLLKILFIISIILIFYIIITNFYTAHANSTVKSGIQQGTVDRIENDMVIIVTKDPESNIQNEKIELSIPLKNFKSLPEEGDNVIINVE